MIVGNIPNTIPGFRMVLGEQDFGSGNPYSAKGAAMCVIALALFDHDWEMHAFVQVWVYGPDAHWQYGLLFASCHNGHVPTLVHDWGTERPSFTAVAEMVDLAR